jgi:nicotinamidase-related amidase
MTEPTIDLAATALVVIDLQQGVVANNTAPYAAAQVVAQSVRLLAAARRVGMLPVLVHAGGAFDWADRLLPSADQQAVARELPPGWSDFVPGVAPQPGEVVILKRQWGAFYGTDLDLQLRRRRIDTLILCGIATEYGVESTARDAYERNFRQFFIEDAMSGLAESAHRNAIEHIFPRMGHVRTTNWLLAQFPA